MQVKGTSVTNWFSTLKSVMDFKGLVVKYIRIYSKVKVWDPMKS